MFIPDPDLDFLPIPDPGSRGQKGTGSATLSRIPNWLYTVYSSYRTGEPRPAAAQAGEVPGAQARHHLRRDVQGRVVKNPGF